MIPPIGDGGKPLDIGLLENNIVQVSTSAVPMITPKMTDALPSTSPSNLFNSTVSWLRLDPVVCGRGGTAIRLTISGTLSARVHASKP